jgi:hypothetical protein
MSVESQVTSLELSQKLKQLGVKQESLFYWRAFSKKQANRWILDRPEGEIGECFKDFWISAFTVAELGEMLPAHCADSYKTNATGGKWDINASLYKCDDLKERKRFASNTEADARAKMLIHLLENNLLKL